MAVEVWGFLALVEVSGVTSLFCFWASYVGAEEGLIGVLKQGSSFSKNNNLRQLETEKSKERS